jgi:hypothetical protein
MLVGHQAKQQSAPVGLQQPGRGDKTPLELFYNAVSELQTPEITLMKRVMGENP